MIDHDSAVRWKKIAFGCLFVVVALNAVAFAVRVAFVARAGPYTATTGFEEFNIYHVWKVVHGYPLYEWPQREHYALTHYNPLFYHVYAGWSKLWGAGGPELVNTARALTPFFAVLGVAVQVHLLRRLLPALANPPAGWLWGLAFLTWFGPMFGGWWLVTVRPDVPAVALALGGFALAMRGQETKKLKWWLSASLLFFSAWCFKQTVVWIYAGTVGQALLARVAWRGLAALVMPFVVLVAAVIAGAGEVYRYSLFVAPRLYEWFPMQSLKLGGPAVALNLFFWTFGAVAGWALMRRWWMRRRAAAGEPITLRERATALAAIPPVVMGAVQISAQGSNVNNLLEGFVLTATFASACWLRTQAEAPSRRMLALGATSLAAMMPLPAVHLGMAAQRIPYVGISGNSIGNVIKLTAEQLERRKRAAAWIQTMPKPFWARDVMLQMPWFSNDNRYPAFPHDHEFEDVAERAGVLEGSGVNEWIERGHFGTLVLGETDPSSICASRGGYMQQPLPESLLPWVDAFGMEGSPSLVWVRRTDKPK